NVMKSTAGVKIFHDNIRIRPYGDPRKEDDKTPVPDDAPSDWLALANRARNVHGELRADQVIGYVLLTREKNPGILETTTRQALVQNSAFKSVKEDFAIQVIQKLEAYIKKRKDEFRSSRLTQKPAALVASETRQLEEFIADANLNEQEKSEAQSKLNAIKKHTLAMEQEIKQVEEDKETTIERYRNLSSLGISALSFHHEIMEPLGRMDVRQGLLQRNWGKWDDARKLECNTDEKNDVETIIDLNSYIKQFASLFSGKMGARRQRQEINPKEEVIKLKMGFEKLLSKYAINFSIAQGGGSFDGLYLLPASFQSVILNLIGNSINALQSVDRKDKWIKLEIEKKFGHLQIRVSDNGIGVKESDRERIFDHHVSTKNNGTGMGLTIVREILEYDYGGTIVIEKSVSEEDKKGAGGTTFLISIPLRKLEKNP
ncbi:MAG: sensor histidine kinase, partial [Dehalococcoidia bacterium]|nr:sensor histidine kinase [Dehalococcoidia bacterium]